MKNYFITGIIKSSTGDITDYIIYEELPSGEIQVMKQTKSQAIALASDTNNNLKTIYWSYTSSKWIIGSKVTVVRTSSNEFLRTHADGKISDNLAHLPDFTFLIKV
jgi:hypothetical protein